MKLLSRSNCVRIILYFCVGMGYFSLAIMPMCSIAHWLSPTHIKSLSEINSDPREQILLMLAAIGAVLAVGKVLAGGEKITLRLMIGRVIIGAGLSVAAAAALAMWPDLSEVALIGIGSTFGILGQAFLEAIVRRWLDQRDSGSSSS